MKRFAAPVLLQISLVHFISHVHIMTIPALLPLLPDVVDVGFVELGLSVSLFNVVSALVQIPLGFATDRFGARRMLVAALAIGSLGCLLVALHPTFGALLLSSTLCGAANGVYHPADYTVLSRTTRQSGMGRAFSLHSFAGFIGSAVTPGILTTVVMVQGVRSAFAVSALMGLAVLLFFAFSRPSKRERRRPAAVDSDADQTKTSGRAGRVFSGSIPLLALVFMLLSLSTGSLEKFSATTLIKGFGTDLPMANAALTAYLFCSAFGVLSGGFLADRTKRHGLVACTAFGTAGLVMLLVLVVPLPDLALVLLLGLVGFLTGVIVPSRDMLVRAAAPAGAEGRVFSVAFTGYNIGNILGPVLFGYFLDNGMPAWVFIATVTFMFLTVAATWLQEVTLKRNRSEAS